MTIQAAYRNKSARKCSISLCAAKWIYWDWINLNWRYNVKKAHIQSLVSNGATLISSWMEMALGALSEFDLLFLILWIHFLGYCKMTWYLIPRVNEIKLLGLGACLYKYFWIFEHLRVLIMIDHLIFGPRERKTRKLKEKNCTLESCRFKFQECMYTCVSGDGFEFRFGLILFFSSFQCSLFCRFLSQNCCKFTVINVYCWTNELHLLQTHSSFNRWLIRSTAKQSLCSKRLPLTIRIGDLHSRMMLPLQHQKRIKLLNNSVSNLSFERCAK